MSGHRYEIPELEDHLDARPELRFSRYLSRNITIEEYQKHQLQYKRIPGDFEFFDKNGNSGLIPNSTWKQP